MMSVNMKKVDEWAKVNDEYLYGSNPGFKDTVFVIHE